MKDCARTHRAWFERHIQFAIDEPPRLQMRSRLCDRDHLRVCGRVGKILTLVVGRCDDVVFVDYHRPNRHFVFGSCLLPQFDRPSHEMLGSKKQKRCAIMIDAVGPEIVFFQVHLRFLIVTVPANK